MMRGLRLHINDTAPKSEGNSKEYIVSLRLHINDTAPKYIHNTYKKTKV
ncbi:MAG: hypothetical protein ACRC8C_01005 [Mycoplasmoidaceae bacterium]